MHVSKIPEITGKNHLSISSISKIFLDRIQSTAPPPSSGVPSAESLATKAPELSGRERYGCPENIHTLGRGTWSFLHTMAAYYPEQPTPAQQTDMREFLRTFSQFYPCNACAGHLRCHTSAHETDFHH